MENEELREQPIFDQTVQIVEEESGTTETLENGSLGKFKDSQALLSAYNNLEAEFTRKCQKLSELTANAEQIAKSETSNEQIPLFETNDWQNLVAKFISSTPDAKNYSKEISDYLLNNPDIAKNDKALEIAWASIVQKNYQKPETLAQDKEFVNKYVLSNEDVKKQVLALYVKELKDNHLPATLSSGGGSEIFASKTNTARDMKEAKEIVTKLFEN